MKSNKIYIIIIYTVILILILIIGVLLYRPRYVEKPIEKPIEITKDSIIRDSIFIVNDSIKTEIQYIEKEYNEKVSNILSSNDSMLLRTFSEYIKHYNNQRTATDN